MLEPGELIVAVTIPAAAHARKSTYLKVRDRTIYAYALASAAVGLDVQGGTIRSARVALGGVGTKPWRSLAAEKDSDRRARYRSHFPGRRRRRPARCPAPRAKPLQSRAGPEYAGAGPD